MLSKVTLGSTDLQVSQFCYGTNMLGSALDQGRSNEILDTFVSLGGNFLDTARMYGDWIPDGPKGASERAIRWLAEDAQPRRAGDLHQGRRHGPARR